MDIIQLYEDYNISYATEGHKHCRPGWINTECPFCVGNPGLHLGYNIADDFFTCWRCGWHPSTLTIAKLLNVPERQAYDIVKLYGETFSIKTPEPQIKIRSKAHRLPSHTEPMKENHRKYLEKRGFDPSYIEREWKVLGTGPVATLDDKDYRFRVIAPIIWNDQQVSFQGRDITGNHPLRYMACPEDRELIHHKHILYGRQDQWKDIGICVEGITDVWRFGVNAFCVFGIKYTNYQVREIAKSFKRVFIIFDADPQAKTQARKLRDELGIRGVEAKVIELSEWAPADPASFSQPEADHLIKQLIK